MNESNEILYLLEVLQNGIGKIHGRSQHFVSGETVLGGRPGVGALEIFRRNLKGFLKKWLKCIIFAYVLKRLINHTLIFRRFGRKTQILGIFEKI